MNERFVRFLKASDWQERQNSRPNGMTYIDYVKIYNVMDCGQVSRVPISVTFHGADKDAYPHSASLHFVEEPTKHTSYANRWVNLIGTGRVQSTLNEAGLLLAMKFVIFSKPAAHYNKVGKEIMAGYSYV